MILEENNERTSRCRKWGHKFISGKCQQPETDTHGWHFPVSTQHLIQRDYEPLISWQWAHEEKRRDVLHGIVVVVVLLLLLDTASLQSNDWLTRGALPKLKHVTKYHEKKPARVGSEWWRPRTHNAPRDSLIRVFSAVVPERKRVVVLKWLVTSRDPVNTLLWRRVTHI